MAKFGGSYSVEIDAPVERCFAIAADLDHVPEWHGSMKTADILERDEEGRALLVDATIDGVLATPRLLLRFSYDEPRGLDWTRESGDLSSLVGSWSFEELDGGRTRATYELDFDPGRVLSMLARGPVVDRLRDHLGARPPAGLKRTAESAVRA